jgi:hypothetical protein
LESLKAEHAKYKTWIQEVKTDYYALNQQRSQLQNEVASFNQSLSIYNQLSDMNFGLKQLKFLWNTILEIAAANNIPREHAVAKFFKDIEQHYDDKLGFESKIEKLQIEVNKLGKQELQLLGEINAVPILGIGVVKLLNLHHDNSNSSSIEEIELLLDQVLKCGGIKAAINKLSQSEQHEKERHDVETRAEALVLVDYQTNKNSDSNEKIEKEKEKEPVVAAVGQDNNHDDDLIEAQFRSMIKKPPEPPEPPSMRALLDGNGNTSNNSNNDSNTSEYFKLRDQVYVSSAGVIKQIGSQQIEQEGEEQQRSLQQKIKDIDDRSHYYVP